MVALEVRQRISRGNLPVKGLPAAQLVLRRSLWGVQCCACPSRLSASFPACRCKPAPSSSLAPSSSTSENNQPAFSCTLQVRLKEYADALKEYKRENSKFFEVKERYKGAIAALEKDLQVGRPLVVCGVQCVIVCSLCCWLVCPGTPGVGAGHGCLLLLRNISRWRAGVWAGRVHAACGRGASRMRNTPIGGLGCVAYRRMLCHRCHRSAIAGMLCHLCHRCPPTHRRTRSGRSRA